MSCNQGSTCSSLINRGYLAFVKQSKHPKTMADLGSNVRGFLGGVNQPRSLKRRRSHVVCSLANKLHVWIVHGLPDKDTVSARKTQSW